MFKKWNVFNISENSQKIDGILIKSGLSQWDCNIYWMFSIAFVHLIETYLLVIQSIFHYVSHLQLNGNKIVNFGLIGQKVMRKLIYLYKDKFNLIEGMAHDLVAFGMYLFHAKFEFLMLRYYNKTTLNTSHRCIVVQFQKSNHRLP